MSTITVTGEILSSYILPEAYDTLLQNSKALIDKGLFNILPDGIYISDDIDNRDDFIERYALYISSIALPDIPDIIWKCSGETIADRRDIIIKHKKVFIQEYALTPDQIYEYTGDMNG